MNIFSNKKTCAVPLENKDHNLFFKFGLLKKIFFIILLFIFSFSMSLFYREAPLVTKKDIIFSLPNSKELKSNFSVDISEGELIELINFEINKKFWELNLNKIKHQLETHNWVKEAVVTREWPNKLSIHIKKYVPVALWNKEYILTSSAKILPINKSISFKNFPTLEMNVNEYEFSEGSYDNDLIRSIVNWFNYFQRPLKNYGLNISSQIKEKDGSFNLVIEDSLVLSLGNKNIKERYDRFLILLDQYFINNISKIETIDLRYMSGVSVRYLKNNTKDKLLVSSTNFN